MGKSAFGHALFYSGVSGYSGGSGYSGAAGAAASSGYSGFSGTSGALGGSGYSGVSGALGASGVSGTLGDSGVSGYSGYSAAIPNPLDGITLKDIDETVNIMGSGSGARTLNITLGNIVTATATGATTWTFSNPSASGKSCTVCLRLTNGGSGAQTWPAGTKWPGGTPPTLTASGLDILFFNTVDGGTTWAGVMTGANFA